MPKEGFDRIFLSVLIDYVLKRDKTNYLQVFLKNVNTKSKQRLVEYGENYFKKYKKASQ